MLNTNKLKTSGGIHQRNRKVNSPMLTWVGIVGRRTYKNYDAFEYKVLEALKLWRISVFGDVCIVTGDAPGVDSLALKFANKHGIAFVTHQADWKAKGKAAGPIRDKEIVDNIDCLIAFPSKEGKGTQITVGMAVKKGVPVITFPVDEGPAENS